MPGLINTHVLPRETKLSFVDLLDDAVGMALDREIEFPHLTTMAMALWAVESAWGKSRLAYNHFNFAGMKWREQMAPWAIKTGYMAHDGYADYCHFENNRAFISGFWARFDLLPSYTGWREHTRNNFVWIEFIGPLWVGQGEHAGRVYVNKVNKLHDKRLKNVIIEKWSAYTPLFTPAPRRAV